MVPYRPRRAGRSVGGYQDLSAHRGPLFRIAVAAVVLAAMLLTASSAFAYDEPDGMVEDHSAYNVQTSCIDACHRNIGCITCHQAHPPDTPDPYQGKGPHGLYTSSTDRCELCHRVHAATGNDLLSASTTTGSCLVCHDGSGGRGVYGTVRARTGVDPVSGHRFGVTNLVPGGDRITGGDATMTFSGPGGFLGCDDCHSPHDNATIARFAQDRWRSSYDTGNAMMPMFGLIGSAVKTNRLLRSHPGGSETTVTVYGSDWCIGCHKGRAAAGLSHEHPVDSALVTVTPSTYSTLSVLASYSATSVTVTGTLAYGNVGYLMPVPRTPRQVGHPPICQQCHGDQRYVGELSADGSVGDAATFTITTTDGRTAADNPRFQTFPHEGAGTGMLVETEDTLCTNCHLPPVLP